MTDFSNKRVLIYDLGLFTELGVTLAKSFGDVLYYSPWQSPFPKSNSRIIGEGLAPNMHRIQDIWKYIDEDSVDLYVFPDVGDGGLQMHLRSIGKRVWGSGYGEQLEMFRPESKKHLKSVGIPVYNWKIVKGIDNLRAYLKVHDNVWVKVSTVRGDFESFKAVDYKNIEPKIDELEYRLGAKGKHYEFIVEDSIDDAVEVGWDGYCIDGQYPTQVMYGVESKDKGYIGHFQPYDKGPEPILEVNAKIAPTLEKYQYRNNWALECRITEDGTPWAIDPCCRFGAPPNELQQVMYTNLADIIWEGAGGVCIDPIPADEYGAELLIHSSFADQNWQAITIPDDIRQYVKLRNCTKIDSEYYVVPQAVGLPEIGAVVATGPTIEAAVNLCKKRASMIQGYMVECFDDCLEDVTEQIATLKKYGINF